MLCLGSKNKAGKRKSDHTTGSVFGESSSRVYKCASCKLQADPDDSIASPRSSKLLHGLAGQRGSEAPQRASRLLPM
jgi:hypothetical protein